ncbi:Cuticular protein hypothetical 5, partial [Caligus rogercresseyi]
SENDFSAEEEGDEHGSVLGQYKALRVIITVTYSVAGDFKFAADIATEDTPPSPVPPAPLPKFMYDISEGSGVYGPALM